MYFIASKCNKTHNDYSAIYRNFYRNIENAKLRRRSQGLIFRSGLRLGPFLVHKRKRAKTQLLLFPRVSAQDHVTQPKPLQQLHSINSWTALKSIIENNLHIVCQNVLQDIIQFVAKQECVFKTQKSKNCYGSKSNYDNGSWEESSSGRC